MNGLVAPKPAPAALTRWTRHAEFLVYLVPVGTISAELYDGYVRLLQAHSVLAIRSLSRPGGYAAELSPFRSFAWDGNGTIRFRFVSTTEKIDTFDGEDVHACARAVGVLGICHCPTTPSLPAAYQQFMDSIRHFPGLLIQKCFAFEHQFDLHSVEACASLSHLVMFPVYHELDSTGGGAGSTDDHTNGAGAASVVMSTVSLHLQVVLDTLCVTILMSLESTVRAAVRQQQTQTSASSAAIEMGDAAGFLLDTNVEPSTTAQQQQQQQMHHASALSPFPSRESLSSGASSPSLRSLPSTPTGDRASSGAAAAVGSSGGGGGVSSLFVSAETRNRRRHLARQRKLFGDYAVLLSCVPDAIEHYVAAIELLRDEERKSSGAPGDTLWLAAALEGYVFCLYQQCQDKFMVEVVEKASEAAALYAKAAVSELEISLVEHVGWYYTAVAVQLSLSKGVERIEEATWVKRLLWELIERGVMVFPELPTQRQVQFLIQSASMLEAVGHHRRMALYLHEAVSLLAQRWRPANGLLVTSPGSQTSHPHQRTQELHAALRLELITSQCLGMADRSKWEVTSLRRRTRRLRRLQRQQQQKKTTKVTLPMTVQDMEPWLVVRFHVLRQLISIAKMLADPILVGRYCIQLLHVLSWCDELARFPSASSSGTNGVSLCPPDQPQAPFSLASTRSTLSSGFRAGLHSRTSDRGGSNSSQFSGVYTTPPASIEVKSKRYFNMSNSPSATMSSAAASITSTIANTPRTLLATPRQQFTAAVSAISTKATPTFSSFTNSHHSSTPSSTPSSTAVNSRSSSANGADLMNSGTGGTLSVANGARNGGFDMEMPKSSYGLSGTERLASLSTEAVDGMPVPVWDLGSRPEVQRLQRRVLGILEAECAVMRPSEQVKLESFVQVDRIRIVHDTHRHPVLKKEVALAKCGVSAVVAADTSSPAFFYNPFDNKKSSGSVAATEKAGQNDSDSEDDEAESRSLPSDRFERCFPLHERVQIEVTLSNPFGFELDLQQIAVLVDTAPVKSSTCASSGASSASVVEAYPSSVALKPYERRKKIVLAVRGLRTGAFHVTGCFIKVLNIKTSFRLTTPLPLDIVDPLPLLHLSLVEIGSLSDEVNDGASVDTGPPETEAAAAVAITGPICMFANETKRCVLRVRNTGQRAVRTFHVTLRAGKAGMSLNVAPESTLFTTLRGEPMDAPLAFETEGLVFKCLTSGSSLASQLPLERGDHLAIPFEVSLRALPKRAAADRQEQLQWTFVYGDDSVSVAGSPSDALYYRQSQQVVTLVPLGSLLIHNVHVLPKSFIAPSSSTDLYDHANCVIAVEIANPTETIFLVRVRERQALESFEAGNEACSTAARNDRDGQWDVEIGRQSSRCLVVEVPRVDAEHMTERSLADVLNGCLEVTWKTYFGTTGRLLFHNGVWSGQEQDVAKRQLARSELWFHLHAHEGLVPRKNDHLTAKTASQEAPDLEPQFPFRFYQPVLQGDGENDRREFIAKLFEPCTIEICVRQTVRARDSGKDPTSADCGPYIGAEVFIVRESDIHADFANADDDSVMITGQTKRILATSDAIRTGEGLVREWRWRVACVFLSEGSFMVNVGGRSLRAEEEDQGEEEECNGERASSAIFNATPLRALASHVGILCALSSLTAASVLRASRPSERLTCTMLSEYFQLRRLIWDDICPHVRASEADELRRAIGNQLIDDNTELKQELGLLVEILSEFQQQSDGIREALTQHRHQRMPEPPGRTLLIEKLKLLACDLSAKNAEHQTLQSPKDRELMKYVLSVDDGSQRNDDWTVPPTTPRMAQLTFNSAPPTSRDGVLLRPGTSTGTRPSTASSQGRPVSRGSTISVSTTSSSIVESPELRQRLNVDEIDSIQEEVQEALLEEKQQLLEDIDFIQSCIDMEQELLDEDRRRVASARPPPSLQELQELRRVLEKSLEDHDDVERLQTILNKAEAAPVASSTVSRRPSHTLHPVAAPPFSTLPRPPPREREHHQNYYSLEQHDESSDEPTAPARVRRGSTNSNSMGGTRVRKIRSTIQEARDEPFLT